MNKSIYLFIGGSLFGVVSAFAIIKSTSNTEQLVQTPPATTSANANTQPVKVITAKMQAEQMSASSGALETMSDMAVRVEQNTKASTMSEPMSEQTATMPANATAATIKPIATAQLTALPAEQPSPEQVEQYNDIEEIISSAANNPSMKLKHLIKIADKLTIQQRNILTQKAVAMLKSGELSIEQFSDM
ncbi:hypothetical protein MNBD_GAMMA22-2470 [hydrothermal vent metagenome]|uniref:Uncharacterized protein n=1 Tax=hydrothermal vent metagenome TaxID=652676 RepID=A0A3B1AJ26_9ZZZZ